MSDFRNSSDRRKSGRNDRSAAAQTFDRLPPQNLDAERGVLGSLLLSNEMVDETIELLSSDSFYDPAHQKIYDAILHLHIEGRRGIDAVTLAEELTARGQLEEVGGVETILQLLETVPHAAHARYYAGIVNEKATLRSLIYACNEILQDAYDGGEESTDVLSSAEQKIFRILESQEQGEKIEIGDILMEAFDRINARMEQEGEVSGMTTGYADLDATTTGFQPTELIILAARPSMGKTAFVCNIANNAVVETGKGVLIFSLEQSKLELAERFLCIHAEINGHRLRSGELDEDEKDRLIVASGQLSNVPLYIDDLPGRTMPQIGAIARRIQRKTGNLGLIIIDYLQLIEPEDKRAPREQQIAQISRRLKFLAKEIQVPVIALAQLNRGVELREDKRPRLADLRESGSIEQDADLVMFLHRPDAYDPEDRPGVAEVVIAKHRSGPTGIVNLTWRKEFMRFENYSSLDEPEGGYFGGNDGGF